jgi:hypothetical protein
MQRLAACVIFLCLASASVPLQFAKGSQCLAATDTKSGSKGHVLELTTCEDYSPRQEYSASSTENILLNAETAQCIQAYELETNCDGVAVHLGPCPSDCKSDACKSADRFHWSAKYNAIEADMCPEKTAMCVDQAMTSSLVLTPCANATGWRRTAVPSSPTPAPAPTPKDHRPNVSEHGRPSAVWSL